MRSLQFSFFFFFNDTATTEIYTLSLHDALPISTRRHHVPQSPFPSGARVTGSSDSLWRPSLRHRARAAGRSGAVTRSEEHTSELQSRSDLVCRLLLEKKKKIMTRATLTYRNQHT